MKCDHCNSNFSSLSSLNNHIKTAKYCIEKRGEPTVNIFNCLKCSKSFSSKRWLLSHESKCGETIETLLVKVNKYEHSIKYLEKEVEYKNIHIKELEKQIQEIALKAVSRPTTTNKTQINKELVCLYANELKEKLGDDEIMDTMVKIRCQWIKFRREKDRIPS